MSDPTYTGLGLPAPILHALTPRHSPTPKPTEGAPVEGVTFTRSEPEVRSGDEQLFTELRMLAELHRAHQAAASGQSS